MHLETQSRYKTRISSETVQGRPLCGPDRENSTRWRPSLGLAAILTVLILAACASDLSNTAYTTKAGKKLPQLKEGGDREPAQVIVTGSNIPTGTPAPLPVSAFPWPPPRASAFAVVRRDLLVRTEANPRLATVAAALEDAFSKAGYFEFSYHKGVPDGFALASRIEQINSDGTPKEETERWSLDAAPF